METLAELGPWSWMIAAGVLFVLELIAPGIFFMWFGAAALATALIAFRYDISWQWQFIWFGGLSLASVLLVGRYLRKNPLHSDQPLLNKRAEQLVGQSYELVDPIVNGRGSVHVGDTIWRVQGPELPKGTRVKIIGTSGSVLNVEVDDAS